MRPPTNHHDAQLWLNAPSDAPDASRKKSLSAQTPNVGRDKAQAESHQTSHSIEHVVGGGLYKTTRVEQAGSVGDGSEFVSRYSLWILSTASSVLSQIIAVLVGDFRPIDDGIYSFTTNHSSRVILYDMI